MRFCYFGSIPFYFPRGIFETSRIHGCSEGLDIDYASTFHFLISSKPPYKRPPLEKRDVANMKKSSSEQNDTNNIPSRALRVHNNATTKPPKLPGTRAVISKTCANRSQERDRRNRWSVAVLNSSAIPLREMKVYVQNKRTIARYQKCR